MAGTNWTLGGWGAHPSPRQEPQQQRPVETRQQQPINPRQLTAKLEWPLFSTPTISMLQVSGYEIYNSTPVRLPWGSRTRDHFPFQFYAIVVGMPGGFRWTVLKSYDEIAFLNKQVIYT